MGRQQYIVRPMVMDESCTPGTGSDNPAIAGSSGVISEVALAHAPALSERNLREHGIPLEQAIEKVIMYIFYRESLKMFPDRWNIYIYERDMRRSICTYSLINDKENMEEYTSTIQIRMRY